MIEMLRTPDSRFYGLPEYPFNPNYVEINGGRLHYIDEGSGEVILCLHGEPTWSYLYRKMISPLKKNYRVIAPDFFGFGRSDKFSNQKDYTFYMHYLTLIKFIEKTELKDITLVVQDWGGLIGLSVLGKHPELFKRVVIMNTSLPIGNRPMPLAFKIWKTFSRFWPKFPIEKVMKMGCHKEVKKEILTGYRAPFPTEKYLAGARVWPQLVPTRANDPGVKQMTRAREVLQSWTKPALVMFSDKDPITRGAEKWFLNNIPSIEHEPFIAIHGAGHFLQEDKGKLIAEHIHEFIQRANAREQESPASAEA
ncbi:MAG: alpha/beta fold hydrolase [Flavobacteriales bacterium]|nr:alpha/beta fold hydrolase [Flavobacteriales bacterium]